MSKKNTIIIIIIAVILLIGGLIFFYFSSNNASQSTTNTNTTNPFGNTSQNKTINNTGVKTVPTGIATSTTINLAKLAVLTGIYPAIEYTDGKLTEAIKTPAEHPRVEDYLKPQGRFKHLFKDERGKEQIAYIQKLADENIKKYNLV